MSEKNFAVQDRALLELAQALRKSHCSRGNDALHECVGECTVTKGGLTLSCKLCGGDSQPFVDSLNADRVAYVLRACGLAFDALNLETQRKACEAYSASTALGFYPPRRGL